MRHGTEPLKTVSSVSFTRKLTPMRIRLRTISVIAQKALQCLIPPSPRRGWGTTTLRRSRSYEVQAQILYVKIAFTYSVYDEEGETPSLSRNGIFRHNVGKSPISYTPAQRRFARKRPCIVCMNPRKGTLCGFIRIIIPHYEN